VTEKRIHHFILTQFNVARRFNGRLQKKPGDAWMQRRLRLFEEYCLPSVRAQRNQDFTWLIRVDKDTSTEDMHRIRGDADSTQIVVGSFRPAMETKITGESDIIIMSRLDNDDAIHREFTTCIRERVDETTKIVDVEGYRMDIRGGRRDTYLTTYHERKKTSPFISLITPAKPDFPSVLQYSHHEMGQYYPVDMLQKRLFMQVVHGDNVANRIGVKSVRQPVALSEFGLS
jgi:hypothetical protein